MKVRVDASVCAGFGVCLGLSPDMFELHDDGYAVVRVGEVPQALEGVARQAANQCPSGAISISEDARS
jgi:ferredoxin